jgi:hypothetical protein
MIDAGIAVAARVTGIAVLAGLGLALGPGTAHAAPDAPRPTSGEGALYGDPATAAPFWRYQAYDDDCVEAAVADVIGELTGHRPTEQAVIKVARSTPSTVNAGPIYTKPKGHKPGDGTAFDDEPALLAHYGIRAVSTDETRAAKSVAPTGITALEQDLAKGRKVIAGVNSEVIWREPVEDKTPDGKPEANHAVVVTGVDTAAGIVHLNDSGSEAGRDERVPIDIFTAAWATSGDQMTVTS